eukprot:Anaeramoba_ignava/a611665_39.p1 GENE.a611665_39~~a611665_39.p1  ORF type:complete len:586 (-),score=148.16 a611665_39:142-1899(-)
MLQNYKRKIKQAQTPIIARYTSLKLTKPFKKKLENKAKNIRKVNADLLHDPDLNKGTGFSMRERDRFHIRGLLPYKQFTLQEQTTRVKWLVDSQPTPLAKYLFLTGERDKNTQLFWNYCFSRPPSEVMPILYTPVVGEACQKYALTRQRYRGLWITPEDQGNIQQIVDNFYDDDVRCCVVTDGGRILGLGDQGANGLPIPIGKLLLYTLCGQVDPKYCLPVQLDVGTNNEGLLTSPFYHGWPHHRLTGKRYFDLVEEFINALYTRYGHILVQFEDFGLQNAFPLLDIWKDKICCFNDDIQGTAAIVCATLFSAMRITGKKFGENKFLFVGAGSAGTGIGNLIRSVIEKELGISSEEAAKHIWFTDVNGLVCKERTDLAPHNIPYAHDHPYIKNLHDTIETLKPTVLIGVSGAGGLFTKQVVETMSKLNEKPVIFALSNPTSKSECTAEQAYEWSKGKVLFASGSPFPPVQLPNGKTIIPAQANNVWIFPALGQAIVSTRARHVTDSIFEVAARGLSSLVPTADLERGSLLPDIDNIRDISFKLAVIIATHIIEKNLHQIELNPEKSIEDLIDANLFEPSEYQRYF